MKVSSSWVCCGVHWKPRPSRMPVSLAGRNRDSTLGSRPLSRSSSGRSAASTTHAGDRVQPAHRARAFRTMPSRADTHRLPRRPPPIAAAHRARNRNPPAAPGPHRSPAPPPAGIPLPCPGETFIPVPPAPAGGVELLAVCPPRFPAVASLPADRFGPLSYSRSTPPEGLRADCLCGRPRACKRRRRPFGPTAPQERLSCRLRSRSGRPLASSAELGSARPALRYRLSRRAPFGCAALRVPLLEARDQPRSLRSRPPGAGRRTFISQLRLRRAGFQTPSTPLSESPSLLAAIRSNCCPSASLRAHKRMPAAALAACSAAASR